jgi:ferrous iron transport protein A
VVRKAYFNNRLKSWILLEMLERTIPLNRIRKGHHFFIVQIPEGKNKAKLIRLGVIIGERLKCIERLPGGTIVIERRRQEIAIGVSLAHQILVQPASEKHPSM